MDNRIVSGTMNFDRAFRGTLIDWMDLREVRDARDARDVDRRWAFGTGGME